MNFIIYYLKLELKLLNRKLLKTGFNINLFWSIVPLILLLAGVQIIQKGDTSSWILVALVSFAFQNNNSAIHQEFLITNIGKFKIGLIRQIRNVLLASPFIISLIYYDRTMHALSLLALALVGIYVNVPKFKTIVIPTPYRNYPFEFIVGFRRFFWVWFLLIPIVYVSKVYQNDALTLFIYAVIMLIHLQFYNNQEPTWYIWNEAKSPSEFLVNKMRIGLICNLISFTIPTLLLLLALSDSWIILVSMWGFSFVLCAFSILNKYAFIPQQLPALQGLIFALNIVFPPLLLFSIPYLFKKAEQNLKHFLV